MPKSSSKTAKKPQANTKVKVLYQNLGGVWYAFADVGAELYIGRVPVEATTKQASHASKTSKASKATDLNDSEAA